MDNKASETSIRRLRRGSLLDLASASNASNAGKVAETGTASDQSPVEPELGSGEGSIEEQNGVTERRKRNQNQSFPAENHCLIEVIKHNGKLIHLAVKNWVELYEKDSRSAIVELLMMLFEACGARYQFNDASLDDADVDDVVVSLVNYAKNGEVEDYYGSRKKELKCFKENLVSFWDNLVLECQNGPLFDQVLFEKCMDYVIALSCTPPRNYRRVATLVGLQLVTSFITVAKTLGGQRETTQRQLHAEKKKQKDGPRVESLNKRLSATHEKITVTEEMMRKIFTGLFMHRYRDIDPDIRMSCIRSLGIWIVSYPSLFLQDLYLKYLGWTLNDKSAGVRKTSVLALLNLYEVDDNVPSLSLFTERFCNRMIELADDIDVSVAVAAIGLLKQLLRHQLLADDELGPLYDLLIDEQPVIRRAVGELVYDHLIAQKISSSHSASRGGDTESSEVHLGRMLQILREFSADPLLTAYVIDDVWDDMKAMKDWKCIISMLLDENPLIELKDVDATSLVRLLCASVKKAVGERIVPATDSRKQHFTKAQKEALETSRHEITSIMMKSYPQLLRKFMADRTKTSPLVEIVLHLKLELYSLKRQEQNFRTILQLIKDAFFKHGEKEILRSCVRAITFCASESQAELRDFAQNKLKELENELILKFKSAMDQAGVDGDAYSSIVNLRRLYELQLVACVSNESLYDNMAGTLRDFKNTDKEVASFLLLNMYLHILWCLRSIDSENPSEASVSSILSKCTTLFQHLEYFLHTLLEARAEGKSESLLASRVCIILADMWGLFSVSRLASTKLHLLGFYPDKSVLLKFWKLCEQRLEIPDDTEDEDVNEEYIDEMSQQDAIMTAAVKLVYHNTVPKEWLAPEIISHFVMHGASVAETVKYLIIHLKKTANDGVPEMFVGALKRAYLRHVAEVSRSGDESSTNKAFLECKDLAARLSGTFAGVARNKHSSHILKIVKDGILFAFEDAPKQLTFLEGAVLPFISKLPVSDILDVLKDVQKRAENINTDEDPSGWRPYHTFVDCLREKYVKNEGLQDEKERRRPGGRGRRLKARNIQGKRLFEEQDNSSEEEEDDPISASDQDDHDSEAEEPLSKQFFRSSKLRSIKVPRQENKGEAGSSDSRRGSHN